MMDNMHWLVTILGVLLGASEYLGNNPKVASNSVYQLVKIIIKDIHTFLTGKKA